MANILTAAEAATVLRCDVTDPDMLALLPSVDGYIRQATGWDWAADSPIRAEAKSAARMLLVLWHEDPGMAASGPASLGFGLTAVLTQLESMALRYHTFEGLNGAGFIWLHGVRRGDKVSTLTGVIGITGDQAASFEAVISCHDRIQQLSTADLSNKWFRGYLVPPESV